MRLTLKIWRQAGPTAAGKLVDYVAAWQFTGVGKEPELHKEPLHFEEVHPTQRSYK